jgi:hypothetical protein
LSDVVPADLDSLDTAEVYPLITPLPITTANDEIYQITLVVQVLLLDQWFLEQAVLEPDVFEVNSLGNPVLAGQGNPTLANFRC